MGYSQMDLVQHSADDKVDVGYCGAAATEPLWKRLLFVDHIHDDVTEEILEEWFIDHGLPVKMLKLNRLSPTDYRYGIVEFHGSYAPPFAVDHFCDKEVIPGKGKMILGHYY